MQMVTACKQLSVVKELWPPCRMTTEDLQTVGTAEFLEDVRFSGRLLKAHGTGPHGTGPNTQWRRRWVRQGVFSLPAVP